MVKMNVNGKDVEVKPNSTVLQACDVAGVEVPRFCYHERLLVAGNCRMCLVEIVGSPKPQASCALPVSPGMKVLTDTERVKKARESVMEFRLLNHPLDCPVCDQGGECDLQDQAMVYGSDRSRYYEAKRGVEDKSRGPIVKTVMTRCIHCTRCIRFASEVAGVADLGTTSRGTTTEVGTYVEKVLKTEMSGNLIDLCPVGALTAKPSAFQARPWELTSVDSVDGVDGTGASTRVQRRGDEVVRVMPRQNDEVNGEWLADKSRFSLDGRTQNRLTQAYMYRKEVTEDRALENWYYYVWHRLKGKKKKDKLQVVRSSSTDMVRMLAFSQLKKRMDNQGQGDRRVVEAMGSVCGASGSRLRETTGHYGTLGRGVGIAARKDADLCIRVGVNPRREAPLVNAKRREGFLQGKMTLATIGNAMSLTMPTQHIPGDRRTALNRRLDGEWTMKRREAKRPVRRRGEAVARRADYTAILASLTSIVRMRKEHGSVQKNWVILNMLYASAGGMGAASLELPQFKGWKPGFLPVGVGLSPEERFEYGRVEPSREIRRSRRTHGDDKTVKNSWLAMPMTSYREGTDAYRNTEGRVGVTAGVATGSKTKWKRFNRAEELRDLDELEPRNPEKEDDWYRVSLGIMSAVPNRFQDERSAVHETSEEDRVVRVPASIHWGYKTDRVPRVHDYYREGHPAARHSVTMAKCSKELGPTNCFE